MLGSIAINAEPSVDYINNKFKADFYTDEASSFTSGVSNLALTVSSGANRFKYKVGAVGVFGFGDDFEDNNLFVLPFLDVSYKPKKGNFTPFIKLSGAVNQNSFRSFSDRNPFVAPALTIKNTEIPYNLEIGTRTKLVSGWEFKMNAFYQKANNAPVFRSFGYDNTNDDLVSFRYANSFEVVYKEIEQIGFDASVLAAFKNGGSLASSEHIGETIP